MIALTTDAMRQLERRTISELSIPAGELMDRAGMLVAETVVQLAEDAGLARPPQPVHLFAGRGNNGGDAFAAARHLKAWGNDVEVWLAGDVHALEGDALIHYGKLKSTGVSVRELPTKEDWDMAIRDYRWDGTILVDGILGTGTHGPARGPADGAIRFLNGLSDRNRILSIDVPSGMNADTGTASGHVVVADITLCLGHPKIGLLQPPAITYVGTVLVGDIGLPPCTPEEGSTGIELIVEQDLRPLFPRRNRHSHKGTYGHLLIIGGAGGANGFTGAVGLAAKAALCVGTGLVTILTPASVAPVAAGFVPDAMVRFGRENQTGSLAGDAISSGCPDLNRFSAILAGPGLTQHGDSCAILKDLIERTTVPLVLDADALNVCATQPDLLRKAAARAILTPHPGEMARLLNTTTDAIQKDRFSAMANAISQTNATVILKGAGTLVQTPGRNLHVNLTGNPGMATAGTGDVLSGLVGGLAAQGLGLFDASRTAVYLHGRAGDCAAWDTCQVSIRATDLLEELPLAISDLAPR